MARKTSLYSAHQKLKSVRSKRTGYRRKRMDLAQGRAKTQIKAEANREALGEVVSGLQSISTMAGEWKQQREMDTSIHKAFEEMGGIQAKEKTGLNKLFGSKYDYYQGDQKMGAIEKHQALVDYSVGEDKKSKYWNKQSGGDETAAPPVKADDPTAFANENQSMASNVNKPLSEGLTGPTKFAQEVYEANKTHSPGSASGTYNGQPIKTNSKGQNYIMENGKASIITDEMMSKQSTDSAESGAFEEFDPYKPQWSKP